MNPNRDLVVLVNEKAEVIGTEEKLKAHQEGLLHQAFSIFILNEQDQMLIQQRGLKKYHFAGLWSNACCSHPMPGEPVAQAAHRRLQEELGFDTALEEAFSFIYKTQDNKSRLYEHELDQVLVGTYEGDLFPDKEEIHAFRWVGLYDLVSEMADSPDTFTPWFHTAMDLLKQKGLLSSAAIQEHLKRKDKV